MTKRSLLLISAVVFISLVIVTLASFFLLPRLANLDSYRAQILSLAEKSLGRRVSYRTGSISWNKGPAFLFEDVEVREREPGKTFLSCKRLAFRLAVIPLLHKEARINGIVLDSPVISLARDQSGVFNVGDLARAKPGAYKLEISDIRIIDGTVRFADLVSGREGFAASLENLDLYVEGISRGGSGLFKFSAALTGTGERAMITCSGKAVIPPDGKPLSGTRLDLALNLKNLDIGRFWPYYGRRLPFERIKGIVDFSGVFRGKATDFTSNGSFASRRLRFSYPGVFRSALTPKDLRFTYDMGLSPRKLSVKSLDLALDGLRVRGGCSIEDLHTRDPAIRARAVTSPFNLADTRQYIPYGIIAKSTADFIEKHIAGGVYRLDSGVLDGRLSRILHMGRNDNRKVLSIRGRVENGIVGFGPQIPLFNGIKGELELDGRDFILRRMSGSFGRSPFVLDGKITDYSLAAPSSYPFRASINPGGAEVAWLLPEDMARKTVFRGPSALLLEGSGTTDVYRVDGAWNLDGAEYSFPKILYKRAGMVNSLTFALHLRKTEAELTETSYRLPPLSLSASAKYRYGGREHLTLAVETNRFQVDEISPAFPALHRFRPAGILRVNMSGAGDPAETGGMHWRGAVSLAAFSLRHQLPVSQLSDINGTISFRDSSLETDRITASLGSSPISVSGRFSGFSNPSADLAVSSPVLRLADLGFPAPEGEADVKNLSADIRLKDKSVTVDSVSGQVKSSSFMITGTVADIENPRISLSARFPFLRVEDFLFLTRLKRSGEEKVPSGAPPLEARITCDAGTFGDIPFRKLNAELSLEQKQLFVRSLKTEVFSGAVSATGQADFATIRGPYYQARYRIDHADLAQIARASGSKLPVGGLLTAGGELSCRGNNGSELGESARGSADIGISNGSMRLDAEPGQKKPRDVTFKKLAARLSLAAKLLEVGQVRIETFEGVVTGGGTADFTVAGSPRYRVGCSMDNIDADKFFRNIGVTRDISGRLWMKAELTAGGDSIPALKKTVRGTVGMHLKKGVINKFNVLSKIFSLLNVSQWLRFRLPDMVTTGMPYDRIDGNFSFNDGIVSSNDLTVKSPAMNITVAGKTDIVKEELDLKIGVQPLQTIGAIVSRIPIVGWILTGGKRSFLVTYYEAKGKWGDPKVSAIPISSLGHGIINIFRRIFNLPEKLVTEPGEVIIGK